MSSARRGSALRAALVAFAWILSTGGALAVEPWEFSSPEKRASAEKQCKADYKKAYAMAEDFLDDLAEGEAYAEDQAVECFRASIALWESRGETKIPPPQYAPYYHLAVIFDGKKQYANAQKCLDREKNLKYVQSNKELAPKLKVLEERLKAFAAISDMMRAVHELQRWNDGAHAMPISPKSVDALRELKGRAERAGDPHADATSLDEGIQGVLREEVSRRQEELDALGKSGLIAASAEKSSLERDLQQCKLYDRNSEAAVNSLRNCDAAVKRVRDAAVTSACERFRDRPGPRVCDDAKRRWPGLANLEAAVIWEPPPKPPDPPLVVVVDKPSVPPPPADPPQPPDVPSDALRRGLLEALTSYRAGDLDRAIDQARRLAFESADEPARGRAVVHATVSCFLFAKWKASPGTGEDVKSWLEADARENARQAVALDPGFRPAPGLFPEPFLVAFADWTGGAP